MPDSDQKLLAEPEQPLLLDRPRGEQLEEEIQNLRRQLEEERRKNKKNEEHKPVRPTGKVLVWIAVIILAVLVLAFFLGWLPKHRREKQLAAKAKDESQELPLVSVIKANRSRPESNLLLPGNIEAITEAPILARAEGYLRKRYVDIGDRVRKGQLLAEVEAPDLDAQVAQGRAQLAQAQAAEKQANASLTQGKANEALAQVTARRYANLFSKGAVSRQENDQNQTNYQAQVANVGALNQAVSAAQQNVSAAEANLRRLTELQSYENLRAPFDGVVTYRNIDVGALISNGSTLLFRIAQIDRLRTYIYVPQAQASSIQVGQSANLLVLEFPSRPFIGTITRTSRSLDPASRTLLCEVQVPNADHTLLPGMYSQVNLSSSVPSPPILIPGDALIVRSNGTQVAVAHETKEEQKPDNGNNDKQKQKQYAIHLQPVAVGRDYGTQMELLSGLSGGELVVVNPNDDVREGAKVHIQDSKENPDAPPKPPGGAKQDVNSETLQPKPGGEKIPQQATKKNTKRGPGY